jgi:hypothetical protein
MSTFLINVADQVILLSGLYLNKKYKRLGFLTKPFGSEFTVILLGFSWIYRRRCLSLGLSVGRINGPFLIISSPCTNVCLPPLQSQSSLAGLQGVFAFRLTELD